MNVDSLTPAQVDALREVANVGCGHAATALSQLVGGRPVQIDVPRVFVRMPDEVAELLGGAAAKVVRASLRMEGDLTGRLWLVWPQEDARRLSGALMRTDPPGELDETHRSALAEAANIVASACLSAMGAMTSQRLVPSVPSVLECLAQAVADEIGAATPRKVLGLETRIVALLSPHISGQLLVLPNPSSVKALIRQLDV